MTDTTPAVPEPSPPGRPRVRIGAVLWGIVLLAVGGAVLWIATSPDRRAAALAGVLALDGFDWTIVAIVTVGGVVTLLALAAVIRSAQRRAGSARISSGS